MSSSAVVITTHNRADVVGRAIDSVLAQAVGARVVLVVDDASTDDTPAVLAAYGPRIQVVRLAPGEGGSAAAARNAGLDALGPDIEIVAFLDDDDEWLPSKLGTQTAAFADDPALTIVSCHQVVIGPTDDVPLVGPDTISVEDLWWINHLHGASCVAVRITDPAVRALRFDPSFPAIEDWDYYVRVATAAGPGSVGRVPATLVRYHDHAGPRLTTDSGHVVGHRRFRATHDAALGPAARRYHDARLVLLTTHGRDNLRRLPHLLRVAGPRVAVVIGVEIVVARARRRDPGAVHRAVAQVTRLLRLR